MPLGFLGSILGQALVGGVLSLATGGPFREGAFRGGIGPLMQSFMGGASGMPDLFGAPGPDDPPTVATTTTPPPTSSGRQVLENTVGANSPPPSVAVNSPFSSFEGIESLFSSMGPMLLPALASVFEGSGGGSDGFPEGSGAPSLSAMADHAAQIDPRGQFLDMSRREQGRRRYYDNLGYLALPAYSGSNYSTDEEPSLLASMDQGIGAIQYG